MEPLFRTDEYPSRTAETSVLKSGAFLALTLSMASASTAGGNQIQHPQSEIPVEWDDIRWSLTSEFILFESASAYALARAIAEVAPRVPVGRKLGIGLVSQDRVRFAVTSESGGSASKTFGGLLKFKVPREGRYRVSASRGLAVEVVTNGRRVLPSQSQSQTPCAFSFTTIGNGMSCEPIQAGT